MDELEYGCGMNIKRLLSVFNYMTRKINQVVDNLEHVAEFQLTLSLFSVGRIIALHI